MPNIKEGESEDDYVKRCIPVLINEGKSSEQAVAQCHGMYKQHKEKGTQYDSKGRTSLTLSLSCDKALEWHPPEPVDLQLGKPEDLGDYLRYNSVCLIGDRIYKGKYLSGSEIQAAFLSMDGKDHDLNHWSTNYLDGNPNVEYIVGHQKNTRYDPLSKRMTTEIFINKKAPHYPGWQNYVDNCKATGRTPNVSVSFWKSEKMMNTNDLPPSINLDAYGLQKNTMIPSLFDIEFRALATVIQGACDDKQGCGIGLQETHNGKPNNDDLIKLELLKQNNLLLRKQKQLLFNRN